MTTFVKITHRITAAAQEIAVQHANGTDGARKQDD